MTNDSDTILFFGPGGRDTATGFRARAAMLETLEASIRLMHEELEVLIRAMADDAVQSSGQHSSRGGTP